jgi:hypothetical protein
MDGCWETVGLGSGTVTIVCDGMREMLRVQVITGEGITSLMRWYVGACGVVKMRSESAS